MKSIYLRVFSSLAIFFALLFNGVAHAAPNEIPPLFAHLLGGNEVSSTGAANAGSPSGTGSATVLIKGNATICFAILVQAIDQPIAAHIHQAVAGTNGPIVVTFVPPSDGNPGASSGCVENVESALASDIRRNPSGYYVNVHTDKFKDGALRGQLF